MQFNIETMCWTEKKDFQQTILETFHGTSMSIISQNKIYPYFA